MALGGWDEYDFIGVCIARFDPNGNNQFKSDNQILAATADIWIAELEAENKEFHSEKPQSEAGDGDYPSEETEGYTMSPEEYAQYKARMAAENKANTEEEGEEPFVAKAGVVYHSKKNTDIPKATLIKKEKGGE